MLTIAEPAAERRDPADREVLWGRLDTLAGFHLRMAQAAVNRDFAAKMKTLGLSQMQYAVLVLVLANPGVSQIDIARVLITDRASMMALVNRLEQRGLVERRRSAADRRKQELHVTETGRRVTARATKTIASHEHAAFSALSPDELKTLSNLLRRLYSW